MTHLTPLSAQTPICFTEARGWSSRSSYCYMPSEDDVNWISRFFLSVPIATHAQILPVANGRKNLFSNLAALVIRPSQWIAFEVNNYNIGRRPPMMTPEQYSDYLKRKKQRNALRPYYIAKKARQDELRKLIEEQRKDDLSSRTFPYNRPY